MKKVKFLSTVLFVSLLFTACSKDDNNPDLVNESEVITTMTVTLTPDGGGTPIILLSRDLDGDGPNAPVLTVSGNLVAGTTYNGSIVMLNETVNPAENTTLEVLEENTDHQFFYVSNGNLDVTTDYSNFDDNNNPLGTEFTLTAGAASSGSLTITLRHEPKKPNDGTLADASGETDFTASFNITIE